MRRILLTIVLTIGLVAPVWAGYHAGVDTDWLHDTRGLRSPAMIALAPLYSRGDYAGVLRVVRPLAESGDGEAQAYLAHLYATGKGVSKNHTQAIDWIIRAAKNGIPVAQHTLAGLTFNGQGGVPRDEKEAIRLLTAAAEQNDTYAIAMLGRIYNKGGGVVRDTTEAMRWWRRGVALNSGLSMWNIGFSMIYGKDVVEGYKWLTLGIKYLEPGVDPRRFRAELGYFSKTKMTPAQVAEAERLVREWKPREK